MARTSRIRKRADHREHGELREDARRAERDQGSAGGIVGRAGFREGRRDVEEDVSETTATLNPQARTNSLSLIFGALTLPIQRQLTAQGFKANASLCVTWQKNADAITRLAVHGLLPESAIKKARQKLVNEIAGQMRKRHQGRSRKEETPMLAEVIGMALVAVLAVLFVADAVWGEGRT
jgi:hypothetical protein